MVLREAIKSTGWWFNQFTLLTWQLLDGGERSLQGVEVMKAPR